jgi:D-alanyl-D-alanine dipeptidase
MDHVRTTVYLPKTLVTKAKLAAAKKGTSMTTLMAAGLENSLEIPKSKAKINQLRDKPIDAPFDQYLWAMRHPGELRKEGYRLTITENEFTKEPMVRLTDYGIVNSSYEAESYSGVDAKKLMGEELHLSQHVYVRRSVAESLSRIDNQLRHEGLFLYIRSGWRHPKVQNLAYLLHAAKHGLANANDIYAHPAEMIGPESIFPHSTGGVIDLEIWNLETRLLVGEKGAPIGAWDLEILFSKDPEAGEVKQELMKSLKLTKVPTQWEGAMKNRRVIYHLMRSEGFYPSGEFWHWGRGDQLSYATAKMMGEKTYQPWYHEAKFTI